MIVVVGLVLVGLVLVGVGQYVIVRHIVRLIGDGVDRLLRVGLCQCGIQIHLEVRVFLLVRKTKLVLLSRPRAPRLRHSYMRSVHSLSLSTLPRWDGDSIRKRAKCTVSQYSKEMEKVLKVAKR